MSLKDKIYQIILLIKFYFSLTKPSQDIYSYWIFTQMIAHMSDRWLLSGSYQIATILIWNSIPQSSISRSRSNRHQTFFRLFHFIFPIRFIPLRNPFSLRLFPQPRQVHLRFLLISALSFLRLIYLTHGHFIVDDPRR